MPAPVLSRADARLALEVFDRRYADDALMATALKNIGHALAPMPPLHKALGMAMGASSAALMLDDAFSHPVVQDAMIEMDRVGPILRAAADMFDALYKAGRN